MYVAGRVQGVFFRSETAHEARIYGVNGWIRNLSDGRVEAVFEGENEKVRKLIEFCKHGPPHAIVTSVDVFWEEYKSEFKDFKMRY